MSVEVVARKDFEDAVRSRWLLGLSAVFVLLVSATVWFLGRSGEITTTGLVNFVFIKDAMVTTLIPLIALVIAYGAVVGERESGSLKLLLSLPHSRSDVVFGKVLGRTGAIAVPVAAGFLIPGLIGALGPLQFRPGTYLGFILLVVVLSAAFVGIAVGFSAAVASNRLAIAGAIGIYFLFVPLWGAIQLPLQLYLGVGGAPGWLPISGQELLRALRILNPTGSFKILANEFVNGTLF
ncbi:MAG: ABC transporter permease, partial [Halobaculum sp.]